MKYKNEIKTLAAIITAGAIGIAAWDLSKGSEKINFVEKYQGRHYEKSEGINTLIFDKKNLAQRNESFKNPKYQVLHLSNLDNKKDILKIGELYEV